MSRVAIVSAMHEELRTLLVAMPDEQPVRRAGREFRVGHLDGHEVVLALCGIGKVAAATTTALLLAEFGVERAIVTGTAGGLHPQARVGDVVVASALLQHDLDASPIFPRYEVPLYGTDRFATDPDLSAQLAAAAAAVLAEAVAGGQSPQGASGMAGAAADDVAGLDRALLAGFDIGAPRVHEGLVVSGDRFVATSAESDDLRRRLPDALAVEMEGAAVAQVCHDFGVRFAVVRTVSDRADNAASVDFVRFVAEIASRYTLGIVRRYLRDTAR
jgi:adenosylhomocysteine nucleosidase